MAPPRRSNRPQATRSQASGLFLPMRVWDLPTRLFHWALVVLVLACYLTVRFDKLAWHMLCGEAVAALLLWRILWGLFGSETARFRHFLASPIAAVRHLLHFTRKEPDTQIGHNAAGGWMVLALLAVLLAQIGTGLFGRNDDDVVEGPLSKLIDAGLSNKVLDLHFLIFNLIEAVVLLHVLAVLAYAAIKGHNLVRPMITGKKRLPAATPSPRMVSPILASALFAVAALVIWMLVTRL